jgi:hypothetical protein
MDLYLHSHIRLHGMVAQLSTRHSFTFVGKQMQVTLVLRVFAIRGFISVSWVSISYPRPNFKAYYMRRTFSRLIRECDADDKLSIREFWRQRNIKMAIVIRFPFYAISLYAAICRNATPVHNESHLYTEYLWGSLLRNEHFDVWQRERRKSEKRVGVVSGVELVRGPVSCPVAFYGSSGVKPSGSGTGELNSFLFGILTVIRMLQFYGTNLQWRSPQEVSLLWKKNRSSLLISYTRDWLQLFCRWL